MVELTENVRAYFERAGWVPREINLETSLSPGERASVLLNDFAGLNVGSTGPGIDVAKSDVIFFQTSKSEASDILQPWEKQTGKVEAIATAHHEHMIIFVGASNFYVFTDPDDNLYDLGSDFSHAMEKLLLGLNYGTVMRRD